MTDETDKTVPQSTPAAGADHGTAESSSGRTTKVGKRQLPQMSMDVAKLRTLAGRIVWGICVVFALILASAVLLVAIDANRSNELVMFVGETSDKIDLGLFDLSSPIKDFNERVPNFSDTGTVLFNYGLAAVAWLVIGRIADAVIRP